VNGAQVAGYYFAADEEFIVLSTVNSERSETTTELIPWSNVAYITRYDSPSPKQQASTASR